MANEQLAECFAHSKQLGMHIGLYRDMAVGVAQGGAETWDERRLYCLDAAIGAPPAPLGPQGQNWSLPPMNLHVMQAQGYQPFIDVLRSNMAHCGALRIDHVMGLLRLWWIPKAEPAEIVDTLRDSGVYSYKVLFFEQNEQHQFRAPLDHPRQSMATITTHDLPTLRGFWQNVDLSLGRELGLYPDEQTLQQQIEQRDKAKQGLLDALHQYQLLPQRLAGIATGGLAGHGDTGQYSWHHA